MTEPLVFIYPGQGAQQIGMGLDLYDQFPQARRRFEQADRFLGYKLSRICFEGPLEELNDDLQAQLAVYTISCIHTDFLAANQVFPDAASGYSSGFYAAGYAAGCYDFEQGLAVVRRAGEILMAEGLKYDGTMANIFGLPPDKVQAICAQIGGLDIGIYNTPSQTIISGPRSAVSKALQAARTEGALDAYLIKASVPYHSSLLQACSQRLQAELAPEPWRDPQIPLFSYLNLLPVRDQKTLKEIISLQLSRPVYWVDLIRKFSPGRLVEVGPGQMLSRAIRWIDRNIEVLQTADGQGMVNVIAKARREQPVREEGYRVYVESVFA